MDAFDRIVADVKRLNASARVGALDERNATVLSRSEFGTINEPPRPSISAAFDSTEPAMRRAIDRKVGAVIDGKSEASGRRILSEVGEDFAEVVRETIDSNVPPENAPSTLAAKARKGQGDRTLVATGEMRGSITVESKSDTKAWQDEE